MQWQNVIVKDNGGLSVLAVRTVVAYDDQFHIWMVPQHFRCVIKFEFVDQKFGISIILKLWLWKGGEVARWEGVGRWVKKERD